jgi:hypothetical protein
VVTAIQQRLTVAGTLRNAQSVTSSASGVTFVSAELHLRTDKLNAKGDILTWAAPGAHPSPDAFASVDAHARTDSSLPRATFDVRRDGAILSRACTNKYLGTTPARANPACANVGGTGAGLPGLSAHKPKGCK